MIYAGACQFFDVPSFCFVIFLYLYDIQQENDTDFAIHSGGKTEKSAKK